MSEPAVKDVLGTIKNIKNARPEQFYKDLQFYIDSKEKSTAGKKKKKKKEKEKQVVQMEYWPLIRVVKIYTKAEALSTGAIVVDLPGVHDSNAARAAVAARYLKQCTGLVSTLLHIAFVRTNDKMTVDCRAYQQSCG